MARTFAVLVFALAFSNPASAEEAGRALYLRYCASCHGADGAGGGPAAAAFTEPPTDLTALAARAGGRYPLADVMASIDGRRQVAAHGSREMPVWGERLRSELEGKPYPERTTLQTVREIAEYVRALQRR
jgi:mono/diheme cytochrome c family protein